MLAVGLVASISCIKSSNSLIDLDRKTPLPCEPDRPNPDPRARAGEPSPLEGRLLELRQAGKLLGPQVGQEERAKGLARQLEVIPPAPIRRGRSTHAAPRPVPDTVFISLARLPVRV